MLVRFAVFVKFADISLHNACDAVIARVAWSFLLTHFSKDVEFNFTVPLGDLRLEIEFKNKM